MTLCDDNHDEVCFDGRECPVCVRIKEISELEEHISRQDKEIKELNERE